MTIPTDRLRELANGATIYGHERNEIAAELLACREERESQRFILSGLRALLVRCGRAVGVKMADEVSTDFLGYVPAEVERVVARLHEDRDAARAEAEKLGAELAAVKRQRDELVKACSTKDDLLACYRLGKRPSEALFKRLDKAKKVLDALAAEQPKPADITLPAYGIDHTGKVVKLVEAEQQSRDQLLLDFAQDWTLDGDLLRCRECKRGHIASREDEEFVHRSDCKKRRTGAMPWKALVAILMQQPKPAGGA